MDARLLKTRAALYNALESLLAEQDYPRITVSSVAERARVGRPTFYRHFDSVDAMLEAQLLDDLAEQMAFTDIRLTDSTADGWAAQVASFAFERAALRPRLYRLILSGAAGSRALDLFRNQIEVMLEKSPDTLPTVGLDMGVKRLASAFCAGGMAALLSSWLDGERGIEPAAMGEMFARLVGTSTYVRCQR